MKETLFRLFDLCEVKKLDSASSFDELCGCIQQKLDDYCETNGQSRGISYITLDTHSYSYAKPEVILWTFLLLNPDSKIRRALDPGREQLLRNALALDPNDYVYGKRYQYDDVAEKLKCSRKEGIWITEYWEILPIYLDENRKTINLPYIIEKSVTTKLAAELYSIYALCSQEEAENVIQEHLSKSSGDLSNLYPGGRLEFRNNELVKEISLSPANDGKAAWLSLNHPFFEANSPEPALSAELFFDYLSNRIYRDALCVAYGYMDHHIVYGKYMTTGYETKDRITFVRTEHCSYHDGGGGSRDSLSILRLSNNKRKSLKIPKAIMKKEYYSKRNLSMPPSEGYWEDKGVLYVINPFGMKSIFIIESTDETWD